MSFLEDFTKCDRITSFGCSFTFGDELSDINIDGPTLIVDHNNPSKLTYAAKIAECCNKPYLCKAVSGGSNGQIERLVTDHIMQGNINDGIVIGWTSVTRSEYYSSDIGYQSFLFDGTIEQNKQANYKQLQNIHNSIIELSDDNYLLASFRRTVYRLQAFLKFYHVPYLMTIVFHNIDSFTKEELYGLDLTLTEFGTFYKWSKKNNYQHGNFGHPLDDAHSAYAKELIKVYNEKTT